MKLRDLQEAQHHAHDPLIMWTKRALEHVKEHKGQKCLGRDWDEGPELAGKNLEKVVKRFTAAFGPATEYNKDDAFNYEEYLWILKSKPYLEIEVFTFGMLEEERRIGVCVEAE